AAVVCADDPGEIASWRALLEDAAASMWTQTWAQGDPHDGPAIVCRTTLRSDRSDPVTRDPWTRVSSLRGEPRTRLEAARDAGARGVVVRVPWGRRGDGAFRLRAGDAARIGDDLAECFEPWSRKLGSARGQDGCRPTDDGGAKAEEER
ncbi:MAG: hypothetical protein ACRDV8_11740, partial [Acidimicrobiales bacterium]